MHYLIVALVAFVAGLLVEKFFAKELIADVYKSKFPVGVTASASTLVKGVDLGEDVAEKVYAKIKADVAKGAAHLLIVCGVIGLLAFAQSARAEQPTPSEKYCAAQLPFGTPAPKEKLICRAGYALDYDAAAKIPEWDAHVLTPKHSYGCVPRSNAFAADASLPADERAKPSDYLHTGYDIGHMSPDADFSYNAELERESFILTNMAPQRPGLNRQTWKYLEEDVRAWAWGGRTLWIITGPTFGTHKRQTIGNDAVAVPTAFWKVIVDEQTGEFLAFLIPNIEGQGTDLGRFLLPLKSIEKQEDVTIPLPRGAKESAAMWDVPSGYNAAKKAGCG